MLAHVKVVPVLCSAVLALALGAAPFKVTFGNHFLELHAQTAWGKDAGKGGGSGGGNNGNGGGNNGGNAGGNGDSSGNSGNGGGKSGDKGGKNNSAGNSGNVRGGVVDQSNPAESCRDRRFHNGGSAPERNE
ncbi:hypothetical protein N8E89_24150 (plasmid) [Phyllobacterium sp. A18/5-2]|uniref:hypothetical protein n=1 Tax=Phyllobacterium sp. A18/5-2 TaxID=2978392 RepID=UPI0021C6DDF2|nr:hypothetical protein [Phyllobacterium sp. A18/5-2]UXN66272.1 hypothetical protein N8E89_24150 [Phyllobacterium sp. A18/5-2]